MQTQTLTLTAAGSSGQADLPASLDDCHAVIRSQAQLLSAQAKLLGELQAQVAVLEEQVNLDSKNSSKPPSSDGPGRGNRAQRRASQRHRGAQPGHKGHIRAMLDEREVDRVVDCKPETLCECGGCVECTCSRGTRRYALEAGC